jgi:membrane protein YdbS with pleckstrin-like domain
LGYLDRNLLTNETVLFRTRLHWRMYVGPVLFTLLVMGPVAVLLWMRGAAPWSPLPVALGLLWVLAAHVRRASSEFAVTNKRVVIKLGVFTTRSIELLPSKIEGIAIAQGPWGKLFGYGDIVVTGSGGTRETFAGIQAPFQFRRAIQEATEPSAPPPRA